MVSTLTLHTCSEGFQAYVVMEGRFLAIRYSDIKPEIRKLLSIKKTSLEMVNYKTNTFNTS